MGDTPIQTHTPAEIPRQDAPRGVFPVSSAVVPDQVSPAFSCSHPQQQRGSTPQDTFASQLDRAQLHGVPHGGGFDMNMMANALPQTPYRPGPYSQGQHRYNAIAPSPVPQFATQASMTPMPGQQYYLPPHGHAHVAHFYPTSLSPPLQASIPSRPDLGYYQNAALNQPPHPASQYYYPQATPFAGQTPQIPGQMMGGQYAAPIPQHADQRQPQPQPQGAGATTSPVSPEVAGKSATEGRRSIVRGPPRKPRQSGHAIWIGNLPPQTDLMTLVHHVCKEAEGLESLFLISKSNCAFANFRDEEASVAAQRKLHDSKFLTVRLVSRLRKSTVEGPAGVTAPTGPASTAGQTDSAAEQGSAAEGGEGDSGTAASAAVQPRSESARGGAPVDSGSQQNDRFFILKSLTVEDIELSVRTNIWATQSHNEEVLNKAFKNSDNVYLIFSANKSGEYFGYARMVSPIDDDPEAAVEFAPKAQSASDVELPKAIPTEATEFAPKGRIIDDSARGTIFWEAERDEQAGGGGSGGVDDDGSPGGSVSGDTGSAKSGHEGESKAWGKPFRLEWLSTARLPFYRTRGLRNAWNSNREVKIARDGTELEPAVGKKLIGLFNRTQSPALAVPGLLLGGATAAGPRGPAPTTPYQPIR